MVGSRICFWVEILHELLNRLIHESIPWLEINPRRNFGWLNGSWKNSNDSVPVGRWGLVGHQFNRSPSRSSLTVEIINQKALRIKRSRLLIPFGCEKSQEEESKRLPYYPDHICNLGSRVQSILDKTTSGRLKIFIWLWIPKSCFGLSTQHSRNSDFTI